MPKKPRILHPVRQVRNCVKLTQPQFAKLVGCSAIAIQRVENGSLKLSPKLAHTVAEATNADPATLLQGPGATVLDRMDHPYSKDSLQFLKDVMPMTDKELQYYLQTHVRYLKLLLIGSERGGKFKAYGVIAAIQDAFQKIAKDFNLTPSIERFLIEKSSFEKRKYRVEDLRKFPAYARLLGFKDKRSCKPETVIAFTIPKGWIQAYTLRESPVLPHGADRKLRDAEYIMDEDRPIPPEVREAISEALYWKIETFEMDPR